MSLQVMANHNETMTLMACIESEAKNFNRYMGTSAQHIASPPCCRLRIAPAEPLKSHKQILVNLAV